MSVVRQAPARDTDGRRAKTRRGRMSEPKDDRTPHYHGHRERLRARFAEVGGDAPANALN